MNKFLPFLLALTFFVACKKIRRSHSEVGLYSFPRDWIALTNKDIETEYLNLKKICPQIDSNIIDYYQGFVNKTDAKFTYDIIDSLILQNNLSKSKASIYVINSYVQGFNFYQCTRFVINGNNKEPIVNFEGCRIDPYPEDSYTKRFIIQNKKWGNEPDINYFLSLKTACNLDGFYVITKLDTEFKILDVRVVLMPTP